MFDILAHAHDYPTLTSKCKRTLDLPGNIRRNWASAEPPNLVLLLPQSFSVSYMSTIESSNKGDAYYAEVTKSIVGGRGNVNLMFNFAETGTLTDARLADGSD